MKNIKLLIITLLFSSQLIGCGMKGPLYQAPITQPAPVVKSTEASQDISATAANKQQVVTEQEKSEKTTENE